MIEQQLVELGPRHLIRAIALRTEAILKIKLRAFGPARGGNLAAILRHESGVEFVADGEPIERLHAKGQERFANMEARKLFPLENNHAPTSLGEQRRGRAAGRPATNDRDVVDVDLI